MSVRARSRRARNSWPSPTPSLAPSIRPGTSATTSWRPSGEATVPRTGCSVVNGYSATFGLAFEIRASTDDLPAFGKPTSAASVAPVAPGRAALRGELLGAEREPTVPALGGLDVNRGAIAEHRRAVAGPYETAGCGLRPARSLDLMVGGVDGRDRAALAARP